MPSVELKKKITYRASQYENLLSKKMREKQGMREISTTGVSETELLEIMTSFDTMKAECKDLQELAQEAQQRRKQDALDQINKILEPMQKELERMHNKVKVNIVGRLVRQNTIRDTLYEVQSFDSNNCTVVIRRLFDQNMIAFKRTND